MKVRELTEQLQRRKSPEELAAAKAAPDYWKTEFRKELNALMNKYGATSRETAQKQHHSVMKADRDVNVLVSGENSMALHRDKRAKALVLAIAKLLHKQAQLGRKVFINYRATGIGRDIGVTSPFDDILEALNDQIRVDSTTEWLKQLANGEKMPLKFNLRFRIELPRSDVQ